MSASRMTKERERSIRATFCALDNDGISTERLLQMVADTHDIDVGEVVDVLAKSEFGQ